MVSTLLFLSFILLHISGGVKFKGKITDSSGEPLIGATIQLKGTHYYGIAGLDGSFIISDVKPGTYVAEVRFVGYQDKNVNLIIPASKNEYAYNFILTESETRLNTVVVTAQAEKGSEVAARDIERVSPTTVNVVSSKSIQLSPDLTVANVVQRVSGLTVQRNQNGDPEYAIVRGMDRRYNYTLINGVKVPSPDDKNRYVPLDIFPANLLQRLEVYKSLTPDMEGDAIGGAVDLIMKDAPQNLQVTANAQLGYNGINLKRDFQAYKVSTVPFKSPRELNGLNYEAKPSDFPSGVLSLQNFKPMPDFIGGFTVGDRFLHHHLGVLVATSFQNTYRGNNSVWYSSGTDLYGSNRPVLSVLDVRQFSTMQRRTALHSKLDYRFNQNNKLSLYSGYYDLYDAQVRDTKETNVDGRAYSATKGTAILAFKTRSETTNENIFDNILNGVHQITPRFNINWKALFSVASRQRPDEASFLRNSSLANFVVQPIYVDRHNPLYWFHNSDRDYSGYLDLKYNIPLFTPADFIKFGGMYRHRTRNNYENEYLLDPNPDVQVKGKDWSVYSDVTWKVLDPEGSATSELNYLAHENIYAGYAMAQFTVLNTQITGGLRMEHTDQGYKLKHPKYGQTPDSSQTYYDFLPSISLKYMPFHHVNIRASYYKAITRPGFFEVIPYRIQGDNYYEAGNANLKHVRADNYDFRFEYFPQPTNQFMVGVFYKRIQDPIEYALIESGVHHDLELQPGNYGTAHNWGIEVDFTKYFRWFGIKGNYTFTDSKITTAKIIHARQIPSDPHSQLIDKTVQETRPLQGQARNIANLSLLYKNERNGLEAQLASVYTGERLVSISPYLDNDMWSRPIIQLDASIQDRISNHMKIFLKANNLLNSPYEVVIKNPLLQYSTYPYQPDPNKYTLIQRDQYFRSVRVGIRVSY